MKWFKHESNMHNDEKIQMLMDFCGLEGYAVYLIILELIAEKIERDNMDASILITLPVLKRKTMIYHDRKIRKIIESLVNLRLISVESIDNLSTISSTSPDNLEKSLKNVFAIHCPNLLKRLDNWTKRSVVATEKVPLDKIKIKNKKKIKSNRGKESPSVSKPCLEALGYLNKRAGTNYGPAKDTVQKLSARLKDHPLEAIKKVIDIKCAEWLGNPRMEQYLRPATLFGPEKFEQYVGQRITPEIQQKIDDQKIKEVMDACGAE